jgi:hypothetical protein
MKDFFISYTSTDKQWAEWIAWQLDVAGYSTVLQAWDFRPGSNFVLDMDKASIEAARTIAVLSPDYLKSNFTQPEWAAAFKKDPKGEQGILLPIHARECREQLKGLLGPITYIDLVGLDEPAARQKLLDGVLRGRIKPTAPPSFPGTPTP